MQNTGCLLNQPKQDKIDKQSLMKAVILVGGEGTRLRPLTFSTVKAMIPVLNKPFIEYVIRHLSNHGVAEVILALGYKPDSIKGYFDAVVQLDAKLIYSVESTPLGTAGAVKNAEQYINDTFFVLNGDIFTDIDLTAMLKFHRKKRAKVTIALTSVDDPTQFGVVEINSQQRINRFIEKPSREQAPSNLINAGIYILEGEITRHIPKGKHFMFEHNVFPQLLAGGEPVFGYTSNAYWIDTGTPEKYLQLNRDLLYGNSTQIDFCPEKISVDKKSSVHPQVKLTSPILIDKGCIISEGVQLKGPIVIGSDCNIDEGAIIENSILWQKVSVGKRAAIKDCIIASNNHVEDYACLECAAINNSALIEKQ